MNRPLIEMLEQQKETPALIFAAVLATMGLAVNSQTKPPSASSATADVKSGTSTVGTSNQLFILIDSLDESLCVADQSESIVALLFDEAVIKARPPWLRFVTTSRTEEVVYNRFLSRYPLLVTVSALNPDNQRDVADYFRRLTHPKLNQPIARMPAAVGAAGPPSDSKAGGGLADLIERAIARCAGNFLVASHFVQEINQAMDPVFTLRTISFNPNFDTGGLTSYYAVCFARQAQTYASVWKWSLYQFVFEVLMASQTPVHTSQLLWLVRTKFPDTDDIVATLAPVESFIRHVNSEMSIFHKSFADWLRHRHKPAVNPERGHRRLAGAGLLLRHTANVSLTQEYVKSVEDILFDGSRLPPLEDLKYHECPNAALPHATECHMSTIAYHFFGSNLHAGSDWWNVIADFVCPNDDPVPASIVDSVATMNKSKYVIQENDRRFLHALARSANKAELEKLWEPVSAMYKRSAICHAPSREVIDVLLEKPFLCDPSQARMSRIRTVAAAEYLTNLKNRSILEADEYGSDFDVFGRAVLHYELADYEYAPFGTADYKTALLTGVADEVVPDSDSKSAAAARSASGPLPVGSSAATDMILWLSKHNVDVDTRSPYRGWTAVHLYAQRGRLREVAMLIQCGANVNLKTDDGWSALMLCDPANAELAKLLLDNCLPELNPIEKVRVPNPGMAALMERDERYIKLKTTQNTTAAATAESSLVKTPRLAGLRRFKVDAEHLGELWQGPYGSFIGKPGLENKSNGGTAPASLATLIATTAAVPVGTANMSSTGTTLTPPLSTATLSKPSTPLSA